eukprot:COSAG05_NODE_1027_length_6117_cov_7.351778_5_plen_150_part_00
MPIWLKMGLSMHLWSGGLLAVSLATDSHTQLELPVLTLCDTSVTKQLTPHASSQCKIACTLVKVGCLLPQTISRTKGARSFALWRPPGGGGGGGGGAASPPAAPKNELLQPPPYISLVLVECLEFLDQLLYNVQQCSQNKQSTTCAPYC